MNTGEDISRYYAEQERERSKTEVGRMIRRARLARQMSVTKLAAAIETHRSAVQHWEHGRRVPSAWHALRLATVLDLPLDQLCARSNRELRVSDPNCPNMRVLII